MVARRLLNSFSDNHRSSAGLCIGLSKLAGSVETLAEIFVTLIRKNIEPAQFGKRKKALLNSNGKRRVILI